MITDKTYKGIFWIPTESDNHKNGLMKFLDHRAYIDLFDSFDNDPLNIKTKTRREICCIHAVLDNGRCCILHNCQLSISGGLSGLIGTLITFDYLFYSSNRDLIEKNLNFSKIEFKLNTLFNWGGTNSINSFRNDDENFGLSYKKPASQESIFNNNFYELKLNHTTSIPLTTNQKTLIVEQDTSLILNLKTGKDILDDFKFIEKIHDIFILLRADTVEIDNTFSLTTSENEEYFFCFLNRMRFKNSKGYEKRDVWNLFTLNELKENGNVDDLFNLWFSLYEYFKYPIDLITTCLSDVTMNSQHKFMNLIYALEHLCSKDLNTNLSEVYFHKVDEAIVAQIENLISNDTGINHANFLGKLKSRLSKNRKLSEKIKGFLIQLEVPVLELFGEDPDVFVEKIVNTRNHYAHVNNKEPKIEISDLYQYNIKLEATLIFIFYLKLGLKADIIKRKIKMHDRFQGVTRRII
jgi:hypothetical protein